MRTRILVLPVAALAGVATAVLPSLAAGSSPPSTASFTAIDYAWDVSGSSSTQATIAQGGTVSFSYPSGASQHNADFGTGAQPSSCTQTAGPSSGSVPPLPHSPTAPGWSGTCTFNTPGTYTFHCDLHPSMTATIVVQGAGTTTGTTTTTTPSTTTTTATTTPATTTTPGTTTPTTATTTPTATGTTPATTPSGSTSTPTTTSPSAGQAGSPVAGGAKAIAIARIQRGTAVRGRVRVAVAGAGGRLEVDLLTRTGRSRVGRLVRGHLRAGMVRFSVPLKPAAAAALRRHKRLALTVRVTVLSTRGVRAVATRKVVLEL